MHDKPYMVYKTKKNETIEMSRQTFARWLCLMEAFDLVDRKAQELEIDLEDNDIVKPLAFEKYIDQRFEGMMLDLEYDERNNLLGRKVVSFDSLPEEELIVSTVR